MSTGIHTLVKRRKAAEKRVVVAALQWATDCESHFTPLARLAEECARLRNVRNDIANWKRATRKKLRTMRKEQQP